MTLGFLELDCQALVKETVIWQRAKLVVQGRIANLVLGKLHVVVCTFDPQHILDACQELRVLERLRHVVVRARAQPLDACAQVARRREKDDGDKAILGDRLDDPARIDAVEPRHVEIEDDEVDLLCANRVDRFLTVVGRDDHQPAGPKQLSYVLARRAIVVGDDHHRLWKWTGTPH